MSIIGKKGTIDPHRGCGVLNSTCVAIGSDDETTFWKCNGCSAVEVWRSGRHIAVVWAEREPQPATPLPTARPDAVRTERDLWQAVAMVFEERATKAEAEVARLLNVAAVDIVEKDCKALLEWDLLRMRAEKAEADVKACQEVYAAARRVVQEWRGGLVNTGPLVPHLGRLAKTVGL